MLRTKHPICHIEIRDTPLGLMAYVAGTRTPVWLICDFVRQNEGNIATTAQRHEWPEAKVRAAMDYAAAHPREIKRLIERARRMTAASLKRLTAP